MTFARKVFDSLLPRGSAWRVRYGGGMDLLFDGIADGFEILRSACASLALLREPLETNQLEDLEREYGVVSTEAASDALRRQYLHGVVYCEPGTGDADSLEDRLAAAGFSEVHIFQNDPARSPYDLLSSSGGICCGEVDASCGSDTALCGGIVGYLLVNGEMTMNPISYLTNIPKRYWPLVFVVASSCYGGEALDDWDMERPDLEFWTILGGDVSKTKEYSSPYGQRALKVLPIASELDLDDQKLQPPTDAELVDWIRVYDSGSGVVDNLASGGTDWAISAASNDPCGPFAESSVFSAGTGQASATATVSVSAAPNMTIGLWVEIDEFDGERTILGNSAVRTSPTTLQLWVDDNGLATFSRGDSTSVFSVSAQLTEGKLHRIVLTQSCAGVSAIISIYLDGELVEALDFGPGTGAPDSTYTALILGAVVPMGAVPAFLGRASMLDTYTETKDADWVINDWQAGAEVLAVGPGVEQDLDSAITAAHTLTASVWEVNGRPGAILGLDDDGVWRILWFGPSGSSARQDITAEAFVGMSKIRLLAKHSSGIGPDGEPAFVVFDDVFIDDVAYAAADVPVTLRSKFERLVLASKPVHAWALVFVNYVPEA